MKHTIICAILLCGCNTFASLGETTNGPDSNGDVGRDTNESDVTNKDTEQDGPTNDMRSTDSGTDTLFLDSNPSEPCRLPDWTNVAAPISIVLADDTGMHDSQSIAVDVFQSGVITTMHVTDDFATVTKVGTNASTLLPCDTIQLNGAGSSPVGVANGAHLKRLGPDQIGFAMTGELLDDCTAVYGELTTETTRAISICGAGPGDQTIGAQVIPGNDGDLEPQWVGVDQSSQTGNPVYEFAPIQGLVEDFPVDNQLRETSPVRVLSGAFGHFRSAGNFLMFAGRPDNVTNFYLFDTVQSQYTRPDGNEVIRAPFIPKPGDDFTNDRPVIAYSAAQDRYIYVGSISGNDIGIDELTIAPRGDDDATYEATPAGLTTNKLYTRPEDQPVANAPTRLDLVLSKDQENDLQIYVFGRHRQILQVRRFNREAASYVEKSCTQLDVSLGGINATEYEFRGAIFSDGTREMIAILSVAKPTVGNGEVRLTVAPVNTDSTVECDPGIEP